MVKDQTYNGWTNYETWNVALWLDNEEGSYHYVRDLLADAIETHGPDSDDSDAAMFAFADSIEEMVTDSAPDLGATMFADLLGAALSEVSWTEIARSIMDEVS